MVDQVITTQELIDAQKDAQTLEEVVNGPANTNVTSRLGRIFPTLATLAQTIFTTSVVMEGNKTQQQINADFSTADENIEAALSEKESISNKGAPNGYLGLDENGKATAGQLPAATETQVGVAEIATQTEVNTATDDARFVTPKKLLAGVKNHLNASGNAPIYACRAWCNFNGTGTVAIRANGNVSSITDNGTGNYTINFINPMPDNNYAVSYSASAATGGQHAVRLLDLSINSVNVHQTQDSSNSYPSSDAEIVTVAIFR